MPALQPLEIAAVVLDNAIDKCLDYKIPEILYGKAYPGARVKIPVGSSMRMGTIVELKARSEFPNLKAIIEVLSDKPYLSPDLLKLASWMAQYYCCPLHKVMKALLPATIRKNVQAKAQLWVKPLIAGATLIALCKELRTRYPARAQVLELLLQNPKGMLLTELMEKGSLTRSPIDTLIKQKILAAQMMEIERCPLSDQEYFPTKPKTLNDEQQKTLQEIRADLQSAKFQTRLIYGITGSGKTEVYLQAIEAALQLSKGVIFLVPEIALTAQTIDRLKGRFKEKIAILHHRLSDGERRDMWHQIHAGHAPIVVGARSAIFSPVPNLGLILVDEEHEGSYKQTDEAPNYHARDIAVMRGKLCGCTVVLGSATPSLESYHNATTGKYALSILQKRADHATLPKIQIVDMRPEFERHRGYTLFSEQLIEAIKKRLERGEQTLLFLNRRGYHTAKMCMKCNHILQCPHCDVRLTFHRGENLLACHLCDHLLSPPPRQCPNCGAEEDFRFKGAGTEMVERALKAILPEVRTLRADADTTRHKGSHEILFKQFKAGKADVLIGTQMIAKGLHFPAVTLVGVLNTDGHLQIPDFRASESAFQLLTQVAGRSGRAALPGEVIIQTQLPEHPVIHLAEQQNFERFFELEIEARKFFEYPPFTHLIKLTCTGEKELETKTYAEKLRKELLATLPASYTLLPVVPCGHTRIKGRFRFQFLIKGTKLTTLQTQLAAIQARSHPGDIRLFIDVDPLSTFF